jgi:hypothetical protein
MRIGELIRAALGTVARTLGDGRVADLEARAALLGLENERLHGVVEGLGAGMALLESRRQQEVHSAVVTIAAIVTGAGGAVTVPTETIRTADESGVDLAYESLPDGVRITLALPEAEPEYEPEA